MHVEPPARPPPPGEPAAEDLERLVHVAGDSGPRPDFHLLNGPGLEIDICVTSLVAAVAAVTASAAGWNPLPVLASVAVLAMLIRVARMLIPGPSIEPLPPHVAARLARTPDERFRLRLVAPANVAGYFRDVGDEAFEPRIARLLTAPVLYPASRRRQVVAVMLLTWLFTLVGVASFTRGTSTLLMFVILSSGSAPAAILGAAAWPSYLRLMPGRLDVLAYGLLGRGKPRLISLDLRAGRVLVDMLRNYVMVERPGEPALVVTLAGMPDRLGFAKAVLQAARCRAPTPVVPDDELVG